MFKHLYCKKNLTKMVRKSFFQCYVILFTITLIKKLNGSIFICSFFIYIYLCTRHKHRTFCRVVLVRGHRSFSTSFSCSIMVSILNQTPQKCVLSVFKSAWPLSLSLTLSFSLSASINPLGFPFPWFLSVFCPWHIPARRVQTGRQRNPHMTEWKTDKRR